MKTLLIMRHAKSSWKDKDLPDIDRPLNPRGEKEAARMGNLLRKKRICPNRILSSPALRARVTAEAVVKAIKEQCDFNREVECVDQLYMAEAPQILDALNRLPDEVEAVLLVGHNPGLEFTVQMLSRQLITMPTAAIAYLRVPIAHWSELQEDTECELVKRWNPKD
ncbi:MAG TPA: histidine phosphatase family protein [Anaerolineaceae bacterium]|nr:histidine phosphatase family protein [Anaerolineaceae bacterium]